MGAALGSQYGAMTVAVEILIAQLHSQSKLTMPIREIRKIRQEKEILKENEPTVETSDLSNDTKKHRLSL
jgi:hypothetical protein